MSPSGPRRRRAIAGSRSTATLHHLGNQFLAAPRSKKVLTQIQADARKFTQINNRLNEPSVTVIAGVFTPLDTVGGGYREKLRANASAQEMRKACLGGGRGRASPLPSGAASRSCMTARWPASMSWTRWSRRCS